MVEKIANQFIDNQLIDRISPLGKGHIHQTFLVRLEEGSAFVLQKMNTYVFPHPQAIIQNMQRLASHLTQVPDYPLQVLYPMRTKNGKLLCFDTDNQPWRATPFFDHTINFSRIETAREATTAARAFGQFAYALRAADVEEYAVTLPNFHNSLHRYTDYQRVKRQANKEHLLSASKVIEFVEREAPLFQKIANLDLPLRLVHNDTKADNVLLDATAGKGICVIDLDTVMPGTILSDFGDMVRTFTNSQVEDHALTSEVEARFEIFEALSSAYLAEVKPMLTTNEKTHLLDGALWIILEQTLRFLTDFLDHDQYYPVQYPGHNLVRAENQMALWQSIWKQREQWRDCLISTISVR